MSPITRCQPLLGTYVSISLFQGSVEHDCHAAIDRAFEAIRTTHRLMSFHERASDLSRLNREAHLRPVKIHAWTYEVLQHAQSLYEATGGLFDCAVAPTLINAGLLPLLPHTSGGSTADFVLLDDNRVFFKRPLLLDLGGIAKGYAVDRAAEILQANGVVSAVVNAGGDLRVVGDIEQAIFVQRCNGRTTEIGSLADAAIATSSNTYVVDSNKGGCLIDPRCGTAITGTKSYSVIAPSCVIADGLTKALAIEENMDAAYLRRFNAQGVLLQ